MKYPPAVSMHDYSFPIGWSTAAMREDWSEAERESWREYNRAYRKHEKAVREINAKALRESCKDSPEE